MQLREINSMRMIDEEFEEAGKRLAELEQAEKQLGETQLLLIEEQERNQRLIQRIAEVERKWDELSTYRFVHPGNGDSRTVSIDRQFIVDRLIDEIYEKIDCGCEPIGETYVVECNCDEYFEQFELEESKQLRQQLNGGERWGQ